MEPLFFMNPSKINNLLRKMQIYIHNDVFNQLTNGNLTYYTRITK